MAKLFTFAIYNGKMSDITDYYYDLPPEKIAIYPLPNRDDSKLLIYKNGVITHSHFRQLADFLPEKSFLFFNDTKVIPARMMFRKDSGAAIEVFLLSPVKPSSLFSEVMQSTSACTWTCAIGNLKRWKIDTSLLLPIPQGQLRATLRDRSGVVDFSWDTGAPFAEVVQTVGETPLPPYIRRAAVADDRTRYQTIYSHWEGAVAAPTAGLHFTNNVLESLERNHVGHDFVTLHVSAGTFMPIKSEKIEDHVMHAEQIVVSRQNIENLLKENFIVSVGTTSMRTLESLYWFGARLLDDPNADFDIGQDEPYSRKVTPDFTDALQAVLAHMSDCQQDRIVGQTSIFIRPGYKFRITDGLITNYHQPASTLILLVAAFVGDDWQTVYREALENDYRFLSYGDSSLLIPG